MFAKAQLAVQALLAGDLDRARELLAMPQGLKSVHAQEYAAFIGAQGTLSAREGKLEQAENCLKLMEELGEEDSAYAQQLERELLLARLSGGVLGRFNKLLRRRP